MRSPMNLRAMTRIFGFLVLVNQVVKGKSDPMIKIFHPNFKLNKIKNPASLDARFRRDTLQESDLNVTSLERTSCSGH
jgi:hypothetical protein